VTRRDELIRQFLSEAEAIDAVARQMERVLSVEAHRLVAARVLGEELLREVRLFMQQMHDAEKGVENA